MSRLAPGRRAKLVGAAVAVYWGVEIVTLAVLVILVGVLGGLPGLAVGIGIAGLFAVLSIPGGVVSSIAVATTPLSSKVAGLGAGGISAVAMAATTVLFINNQMPLLYSERWPLLAMFVVVAALIGLLAGAITARASTYR